MKPPQPPYCAAPRAARVPKGPSLAVDTPAAGLGAGVVLHERAMLGSNILAQEEKSTTFSA